MSKSHNAKKSTKKAPQKSQKEKRAEKRAKKSGNSDHIIVNTDKNKS